jgi:hypothetical protein
MSEDFLDTMIRSKGMINDYKVTELIDKDKSILEISTISSSLDNNFDLVVVTDSKSTCLDLIKNGIRLSNRKIAKIKAIFNDTNRESNPFLEQQSREIPGKIPQFGQRLDRDTWQEEQYNNLRPEEREPSFGMGNSNFNDFNRNDPIFRQGSFY